MINLTYDAPVRLRFIRAACDRPIQKLFAPFGYFRAKFLNPAKHSRPINGDPAFFQEINDILIRQRIPQIPPHSAKDNITWKTVVFERRTARNTQP